jgi:hypothetical protein
MKHDYDNLKRGALSNAKGKTRVTMFIDDDVLSHFRDKASSKGRGYQTEINAYLRTDLSTKAQSIISDVRLTGFEVVRSAAEPMQVIMVTTKSAKVLPHSPMFSSAWEAVRESMQKRVRKSRLEETLT